MLTKTCDLDYEEEEKRKKEERVKEKDVGGVCITNDRRFSVGRQDVHEGKICAVYETGVDYPEKRKKEKGKRGND